ncbi:hypothetical protein IJJ27_04125 [bacterium]|nr:hypothetical protein [bacterium]MBQ6436712.1 hypothetical protein [bacterium]
MKKYMPIILPILALALVAYFGIRWYRSRTTTEIETPEVTTSTTINSPTGNDQTLLENLQRGLGNFQTVNLDTDSDNAMGEIRYQTTDGRAVFSVNANLPTDIGEVYHLWVKSGDSNEFTDLGKLEDSKGGLLAGGSVDISKLPVTVEIRRGSQVVLTGTIPAAN